MQEFQKEGVGKKLVKALTEELLGMGLQSMIVVVLEENPAKHFYKKLGGQYLADGEIEISGKKIKEQTYGWRDIHSILEK